MSVNLSLKIWTARFDVSHHDYYSPPAHVKAHLSLSRVEWISYDFEIKVTLKDHGD